MTRASAAYRGAMSRSSFAARWSGASGGATKAESGQSITWPKEVDQYHTPLSVRAIPLAFHCGSGMLALWEGDDFQPASASMPLSSPWRMFSLTSSSG